MPDTYTAYRRYPHEEKDLGEFTIVRRPVKTSSIRTRRLAYHLASLAPGAEAFYYFQGTKRRKLSPDGRIYRRCVAAARHLIKHEAGVDAPSPGSALAKKRGCTCPIIDNNYGKGSHFVQRADCPIHGFDAAA